MDDSRTESDDEVGQRLRQLRLARRLTLKDVATEVGITEGFLSQIETGRSAPSLRTFRNIATALGVMPSDILDSHDVPLPRHVHSSGGHTISIGDVSKFRVTPPSMASLDIIRGELAAGGSTGEGYTHGDSDEALVLLSGSVIATVNGQQYPLENGDVLCYRSSMIHSVRNEGAEPATVLWVVSPPSRATQTPQ